MNPPPNQCYGDPIMYSDISMHEQLYLIPLNPLLSRWINQNTEVKSITYRPRLMSWWDKHTVWGR